MRAHILFGVHMFRRVAGSLPHGSGSATMVHVLIGAMATHRAAICMFAHSLRIESFRFTASARVSARACALAIKTHTHTHCAHNRIHTHAHTHAQAHKHTYARTHTYTHAHMHARIRACARETRRVRGAPRMRTHTRAHLCSCAMTRPLEFARVCNLQRLMKINRHGGFASTSPRSVFHACADASALPFNNNSIVHVEHLNQLMNGKTYPIVGIDTRNNTRAVNARRPVRRLAHARPEFSTAPRQQRNKTRV